MAKETRVRLPKLCRHKMAKRADQAFVTISGKRRYLGPWGSREAREQYQRICGKLLLGQDPNDESADAAGITVEQMAVQFLQWADRHYRHPDGEATGEAETSAMHCTRCGSCMGHGPPRALRSAI